MRTATWGYKLALLSALGLTPVVSCATDSDEAEPGTGGASSGGRGDGGKSSTGGHTATGGRLTATGGGGGGDIRDAGEDAPDGSEGGNEGGAGGSPGTGGSSESGGSSYVDGRPFLVGGAARVAAVASRSGWCSSLLPDTAGLGKGPRKALADHWLHVGLMEHASIAAFARFALELMSLGAPASLLLETQAAIADETAHARDAFALASAYAGDPLGPGGFDYIASSLSDRSPADIVLTAILEGCIGETVASVDAAEALAHAEDPAVRQALTRIAADEARHAALAWRFIQWVVMEGPSHLRRVALNGLGAVVDAELAAARPSSAVPRKVHAAELPAHGMMAEATRREVRLRVLAEVVAPCARELARSARPRSDALEPTSAVS